MAEPTQKKNKGRHTPNLAVVGNHSNPPAKHVIDTAPSRVVKDLSFWTQHPTEPKLVKLREFATGRIRSDLPAKSRKGWAGDFSGRPELIAQLRPIIEQEWLFYARPTIRQALASLRAWWRVLDESEKVPKDSTGVQIPRLRGVEHLHELHYAISRKMGIDIKQHAQFMRLVNLRRQLNDLPTLYWPSPDANRKDTDVPTHWEMEAIRHRLKHGWFAALDRWAAADRRGAAA